MPTLTTAVCAAFAALALLVGACEVEDDNDEQYRCECQVTCDGQSNPWTSFVCSAPGDINAATAKADANCERVQSEWNPDCAQVSCACPCTATGDAAACD